MDALWSPTIGLGVRNASFLVTFRAPRCIPHDYSPEAYSTGRHTWQLVNTSLHRLFQRFDSVIAAPSLPRKRS
jgi:hypothetical protein